MRPLFPSPRHVAWGDPSVTCAEPAQTHHDPTLPTQGYELHVDEGGVRLAHADDAGRRYGEQTLARLRGPDGSVPAVHVRDWPDVPIRGFLLDVSRDRVPTRQTLARLVSLLAVARYNHLQLSIEHAFAYRDHAVVWQRASPITHDDLIWLDQRCASEGIELVANQASFGHFARWLQHDRYRARAECPDGVEAAGFRLPPSVLAPTDANARLAVELVREQLALLRNRRANIGCDETFELGRCASAARATEIGTIGVYLEHLERIARPLLDDGCQLLLWGDVVARHPDRIADLPTGDLTYLVWGYDAPGAPVPSLDPAVGRVLDELGIRLDDPTEFETRIAPFLDADVPFWLAPGTSSWNSLVGRLDSGRANLLDAARVAAAHGVPGVLVTDWGDGGHHQPPSVSDPPLLYGGAVTWCVDTNADLDLPEVVDREAVDDPTGTIGGVLEAIGSVSSRTGVVARNLSPLYAALFPHQPNLTSGRPDPGAMTEVLDVLAQARDDLGRARPRADDGDVVIEELDVAISLAQHGARRLAVDAGVLALDAEAMHADLAPLVERYRSAWTARSRPGGLDDSAAHLERTLLRYRPT